MLTRRSILGLSLGAAIGCLIPTRDRWRKLFSSDRTPAVVSQKYIVSRRPVFIAKSGTRYEHCTIEAAGIAATDCDFVRCIFRNTGNGGFAAKATGCLFLECRVFDNEGTPIGFTGLA